MKQSKIAITGGIGSGKSAVSDILRSLGMQVLSADLEYASVLGDPAVLNQIDREFHVVKNGVLDRRSLSAIVFSDPVALSKLNSLTHPLVMKKLLANMTEPLSFAEVPLLFEGGFAPLFDGVIVVMREKEDRIRSVIKRSGLSREEVENRIKNQFDYENNDLSEHTLIWNDGDLNDLRRKVERVLASYHS